MSGKTGQLNRASNIVDVNGLPYDSTRPFPVTTPVPAGGPGAAVTIYDQFGNPVSIVHVGAQYAEAVSILDPSGTQIDSNFLQGKNGLVVSLNNSAAFPGTVDTELGAAITAGDGLGNPTSPFVLSALFGLNGATWDRLTKSAANSKSCLDVVLQNSTIEKMIGGAIGTLVLLQGISDGTNAQALRGDGQGRPQVVGSWSDGSAAGTADKVQVLAGRATANPPTDSEGLAHMLSMDLAGNLRVTIPTAPKTQPTAIVEDGTATYTENQANAQMMMTTGGRLKVQTDDDLRRIAEASMIDQYESAINAMVDGESSTSQRMGFEIR